MPLQMNDQQVCPSCHAPLPAGASEGELCAACARVASIADTSTLLGGGHEFQQQQRNGRAAWPVR
jgi:hypothetical protein